MSTPPPAPPSLDLLRIGWTDLAAAVHADAWVTLLVLALAVTAAVRLTRTLAHRGPRDPVRHFDALTTATVVHRAGGRCETQGLLGRCVADAGLRAVHVHPWAHGGQTDLANARAACPEHAARRPRVPGRGHLERLAARRLAYFPADADPVVVRHATPRCVPRSPRVTVEG